MMKRTAPVCEREPWDFSESSERGWGSCVSAFPEITFGQGLESEVRRAVLQVAENLKEEGAAVEEFDLGTVPYVIPAYYRHRLGGGQLQSFPV